MGESAHHGRAAQSGRSCSRMMAELVRRHPEPTAHFAERTGGASLRRRGGAADGEWVARSLPGAPLLEVVQQEHRRQAVQQTSLAECDHQLPPACADPVARIFSKRSAGRMSNSPKIPLEFTPRVDFETRNRYRERVEEIARWSKTSELEVIGHALALAEAAEDELGRHVGYYLIDEGRQALERATGARVPLAERSRRWLRAHAAGSISEVCSCSRSRWWPAPLAVHDRGRCPESRSVLLWASASACPRVSWRCWP